jgi:hypothetical protein
MKHYLEDKIVRVAVAGINPPVIPSAKTTVSSKDGLSIRQSDPIYITHLKTYEKTGSLVSLSAAILSMLREIAMGVNRGQSLHEEGWEAPLAVSNGVPYGEVYIDYTNQRIILNEVFATERYCDADGDRAKVYFGTKFIVDEQYQQAMAELNLVVELGSEIDHTEFVVIEKYPLTSPPPIVKICKTYPSEVVQDFGFRQWEEIRANLETPKIGEGDYDLNTLLMKSVTTPNVGLTTSAWNTFDLYNTQHMSWYGKIFNIYQDSRRAIDVEDNGMKVVRKDGVSARELHITPFAQETSLMDHFKPALTSKGSIKRYGLQQLQFLANVNLETYSKAVLDLNVSFRPVIPNTFTEQERECCIDCKLIPNLEKVGLIRFIDLPKEGNNPPACVMYLSLEDGTPAACADIKREDSQETGLTYAYVLYPVYDNLDLYNEQTGEISWKASKRFLHPREFMAKALSTFDTRVKFEGKTIGFWLDAEKDKIKALKQFKDPKWATRVAMLEKAIRDYAGVYGDPVPAEITNNKRTISPMANAIAKRTVVIDAGKERTPEELAMILLEANKVIPINYCGSKSNNMRIRKIPLANAEGGAAWAPLGVHPSRPGKLRSQLLRSTIIPKMTVAVIKGDTLYGALIGNSGVAKQTTATCFLPQVLDTLEDYNNLCTGFGKDPKEFPPRIIQAKAWSGETRVYYGFPAKAQIKIGKLVDNLGNKFMPRYARMKIVTNNGQEDLDLAIPYNELVAKGNHDEFLKNAVERTVIIGDRIVNALVVEHQFFRTQTASENMPARKKTSNASGMDMFVLYAQLLKLKNCKFVEPNLGFPMELQNSLRQLIGEESFYDFNIPQKEKVNED